MSASTDYLTGSECALLLRLARASLESFVSNGERIDLSEWPLTDTLQEKHGAFVTLREGGQLRGCIGYTRSLESLAEAVRDNAINAGTRDPRFPPVSRHDLPHLSIEVSALCPGEEAGSPFFKVHHLDEIVLGRDGLYLELGHGQGGGLLLPQVPGEQGWNLAQFLEGVSRKSGAAPDAWRDPANTLYRFSAQVFAED